MWRLPQPLNAALVLFPPETHSLNQNPQIAACEAKSWAKPPLSFNTQLKPHC